MAIEARRQTSPDRLLRRAGADLGALAVDLDDIPAATAEACVQAIEAVVTGPATDDAEAVLGTVFEALETIEGDVRHSQRAKLREIRQRIIAYVEEVGGDE